MRILKRVNTILTAHVNEVIDTFEKPERMLKQAIREMEESLTRAIGSTARGIAAEKGLKRERAECRAQAEAAHERALRSLGENDEAQARKALARRLEKEKLADSLDLQVARSEELTARLRRQLEALRDQLADARRQLASLVARQQAAEARREFVRVVGRFDVDLEAFGRFEEFARRVDETEAEADAHCELLGFDNEEPDSATEVEAALEALKNERAAATGP